MNSITNSEIKVVAIVPIVRIGLPSEDFFHCLAVWIDMSLFILTMKVNGHVVDISWLFLLISRKVLILEVDIDAYWRE